MFKLLGSTESELESTDWSPQESKSRLVKRAEEFAEKLYEARLHYVFMAAEFKVHPLVSHISFAIPDNSFSKASTNPTLNGVTVKQELAKFLGNEFGTEFDFRGGNKFETPVIAGKIEQVMELVEAAQKWIAGTGSKRREGSVGFDFTDMEAPFRDYFKNGLGDYGYNMLRLFNTELYNHVLNWIKESDVKLNYGAGLTSVVTIKPGPDASKNAELSRVFLDNFRGGGFSGTLATGLADYASGNLPCRNMAKVSGGFRDGIVITGIQKWHAENVYKLANSLQQEQLIEIERSVAR